MVIHEDLIEPESTSPTKALYVNKEFDEDLATKEDKKIFNSYLSLRFIDDTSVEGTPERALIKKYKRMNRSVPLCVYPLNISGEETEICNSVSV